MKKRKKRGRPKIAGKIREPNGRISRTKTPRKPANQLTLEIRAKRYGVSIQDVKKPFIDTYVGRLYLLEKKINQDQYDASQQYIQVLNNYRCAKQLPGAIYDETPISSDDRERDKWVETVTDRYEAMQEVIRETQRLHRRYNLHDALEHLVIEDQQLPHLVNSLRMALNAFKKYFS
ncbi:hypothetical protein [Bartonella schoenbuchensis]|uniref:Uncharacterized protein n=2 Tax=Bartonella schoenbuchensis TaxID=165694 RepID=E6Z0M4_BARSR|nr:hypothetical protein [Bartonella schoenbuchensis]AQX31563.1 hypothetical protein BscR1v2_016600 [Bartonella schoenbuchensis R1]CBI82662.1 conserved hypothetical protein [Bartonella schoenbuchensis R1]CDP79700.1 hypothetical protein BN1046_00597 [Bartonella schoenbuchensis]